MKETLIVTLLQIIIIFFDIVKNNPGTYTGEIDHRNRNHSYFAENVASEEMMDRLYIKQRVVSASGHPRTARCEHSTMLSNFSYQTHRSSSNKS